MARRYFEARLSSLFIRGTRRVATLIRERYLMSLALRGNYLLTYAQELIAVENASPDLALLSGAILPYQPLHLLNVTRQLAKYLTRDHYGLFSSMHVAIYSSLSIARHYANNNHAAILNQLFERRR